ncbi:hypothetical protein KM043_013826 [Ampulex compressa]|nr:hypothetical protein KM043_013826 [Ampulex compressa]
MGHPVESNGCISAAVGIPKARPLSVELDKRREEAQDKGTSRADGTEEKKAAERNGEQNDPDATGAHPFSPPRAKVAVGETNRGEEVASLADKARDVWIPTVLVYEPEARMYAGGEEESEYILLAMHHPTRRRCAEREKEKVKERKIRGQRNLGATLRVRGNECGPCAADAFSTRPQHGRSACVSMETGCL